MAILGYVFLVLAMVTALWLQWENSRDIEETSRRMSIEICEEINDVKSSIIRVQEARQPLPVPDETTEDVRKSIERYNRLQKAYIERFKEEIRPSDCNALR